MSSWRPVALLAAVTALLATLPMLAAAQVSNGCGGIHLDDYYNDTPVLMDTTSGSCQDDLASGECPNRCKSALERLGLGCVRAVVGPEFADRSTVTCGLEASEVTPCYNKGISLADQERYGASLASCPPRLPNNDCSCGLVSACKTAIWKLGRRCSMWLAYQDNAPKGDAYWDSLFSVCGINIGGSAYQPAEPCPSGSTTTPSTTPAATPSTTPSTTPTATARPSPATATGQSPRPSTTSTPGTYQTVGSSGGGGGMSTGVIAGVAVGVGVLVAVAVAGSVVMVRRHQRRQGTKEPGLGQLDFQDPPSAPSGGKGDVEGPKEEAWPPAGAVAVSGAQTFAMA